MMVPTSGEDVPRAFVLISFESQFERVYSDLIKAPLEEAGFRVERADSRLNQRSILQDIVRGIATADLIVADLTGLNPNVFYELGIAHALGIPTVLLTQNIQELPFDLRAYRANEYSTHFAEAETIRTTIGEIGRDRIGGTISFGSPVTDFLPSDFRRNPPAAPALAAAELPEMQDEQPASEIAWFDALQRSEELTASFVEAMDRISAATEEIGKKVGLHTAEMERLTSSPESERMKRTSVLAIRFAHDLDAYAQAVEQELPTFEEGSTALLQGMTQYLAWVQSNPEVEADETLTELQSGAEGLLEATRGNIPILQGFRDSIASLQGFSRAINSAAVRVTGTLDRLISHTETIEAEATRLITASAALIQERGSRSGEQEEASDDDDGNGGADLIP